MIKRLSNKEQRANIDYVKWVLVTAFTTDTFVPFDSFTMWQLLPGESVDVLLAELERLILLIGDALPEKWMKFAFVVVLLSHVRQHFWATSRMADMTLGQILTGAQAISVTVAVPTILHPVHWPVITLHVINVLNWTTLQGTASISMERVAVAPYAKRKWRYTATGAERLATSYLSVWETERERVIDVSLSPINLKEVFPVIEYY